MLGGNDNNDVVCVGCVVMLKNVFFFASYFVSNFVVALFFSYASFVEEPFAIGTTVPRIVEMIEHVITGVTTTIIIIIILGVLCGVYDCCSIFACTVIAPQIGTHMTIGIFYEISSTCDALLSALNKIGDAVRQ